jgi:hypothetical protein
LLSRGQVILVLAVVCAAGSGAFAAEPAEVEALIQEANKFRREGKDGMALPLMRKAYDQATTARTAAQLGLVEVALGYWLQAEQHLEEALSSPRDPWIHQNRMELERVLAGVRASIGEVEIVGQPVGAEVTVNGQSVGTLPLSKPVRVGDGPVRLEVRADGYQSPVQTLTMSKGAKQKVDVRLARAIGAQPSPSAPMPVDAPSAMVAKAAEPAQTGAHRPGAPTAAWVAAGAAAAAVGVGVVGAGIWVGKRDDFDKKTAPVLEAGVPTQRRTRDCGVQNHNRGGEECARIYDSMTRAKTIAAIGYVSGGVLALGAGALFLLSPRTESRNQYASVVCAPTVGAFGGACRLAF